MGNGGLVHNQMIQNTTCMSVKVTTVSLCCRGPNHFMALLLGSLARKATNTSIVFPRTQEIQRTKVIPNAVWRSMQDHSEGLPMKVREQRKHSFKEMSKRKLSSELFAFTIGLSLYVKNISDVKRDKNTPVQLNPTNTAPIISW